MMSSIYVFRPSDPTIQIQALAYDESATVAIGCQDIDQFTFADAPATEDIETVRCSFDTANKRWPLPLNH